MREYEARTLVSVGRWMMDDGRVGECGMGWVRDVIRARHCSNFAFHHSQIHIRMRLRYWQKKAYFTQSPKGETKSILKAPGLPV